MTPREYSYLIYKACAIEDQRKKAEIAGDADFVANNAFVGLTSGLEARALHTPGNETDLTLRGLTVRAGEMDGIAKLFFGTEPREVTWETTGDMTVRTYSGPRPKRK